MMGFCSSCKQLDISLASFISHPGTDDNSHLQAPIYSFGNLEVISTRTKQCHLCRLLLEAFRNGPLKNIVNFWDLRQVAIFGTWINALGPTKEERLRSSALSILLWPESPRIPSSKYKVIIRPVSRLLPDNPHFGRISPVKTDFLDFELIKRWLDHCGTNHATCNENRNAPSAKPTATFLLIDVRDMCIIPAREGTRYITLSYVWGNHAQPTLTMSQVKAFSQKYSLMNIQLPFTISDSIKLDSEGIRRQCIEDMDKIYAQSAFTIIASTAINSNSPLPGVSSERTWRQWHVQISPNFALSAHFDFKDFVTTSKYDERAWTFQEYQLANRLLIFASNGQVYYSYKEAVYSEEVVTDKNLCPDAALKEGGEMTKLRTSHSNMWSMYRQGVEIFSFRSLTHEGDILNAFRGVLRTIYPGRSLEGLPASAFDLALLWQPRGKLKRRVGFSSWSWAGWVGKVHWFDDDCFVGTGGATQASRVEAWLKEKCWIVWYNSFGNNTNSSTYLTEGPPWLSGSSPTADQHHARFGSQPRNFIPTADLLPRRLKRLEAQRKYHRYLQFWTISVYFSIECDTKAVTKFSSFSPENTGNGSRLFYLRDANSQVCGWVLLDESWNAKNTGNRVALYEFIILSQADSCTMSGLDRMDAIPQNDGERVAQDHTEMHAMMITWSGGIAERVGLERVSTMSLSHSCGRCMRWKEILLG